MNTLIQMRSAIQKDFNVSTSSSLFPADDIDSALNRAYHKASSLVRWPALEDAKKTTTQALEEYYDVPETWRPDSMWRLVVDDEVYGEKPDFSPLEFSDFLDWKDSNPDSTEKKWSAQWLRYFIQPIPTVADLVICIWGQKNITEMSEDSSTTIFSYNMPECNEAILLEAKAILNKGDKLDSGQFFSGEAKQILLVAHGRIAKGQAKYEKIQPMFNTPDFYAEGGINTYENLTGRF